MAVRLALFPLLLLLAGCNLKDIIQQNPPSTGPDDMRSLAEARKGFETKLTRRTKANQPVEAALTPFRSVQYDAPVGKCAAYLTSPPRDGKKHPAIIWITGGDCNTIGDVWSGASTKNDQSARQYREFGIVMMFPSLRGGNQNPGFREGLFGEVDDVLAAADFLAKQPHVDPDRIYLGGHSTGGTLVMLVAACSDRFRGVFAFGPADDVSRYPGEYTPFDTNDPREVALRSPGKWTHSIQSPTFVFEGEDGNVEALRNMQKGFANPKAQFFPVRGGDHFDILAPLNRLIARKILADTGPQTNITFTADEVRQAFGQ